MNRETTIQRIERDTESISCKYRIQMVLKEEIITLRKNTHKINNQTKHDSIVILNHTLTHSLSHSLTHSLSLSQDSYKGVEDCPTLEFLRPRSDPELMFPAPLEGRRFWTQTPQSFWTK